MDGEEKGEKGEKKLRGEAVETKGNAEKLTLPQTTWLMVVFCMVGLIVSSFFEFS